MENAKKFFEETIKTEEAKKILASMEKPETPEEILSAYSEVAEKLGFEISADELTAYLSKGVPSGEVDDEELSQLTGGGDHAECKDTYQHKENCWWNDGCDLVNNKYDSYECNRNLSGTSEILEKVSECGQVMKALI